jgi:hypothetical protein
MVIRKYARRILKKMFFYYVYSLWLCLPLLPSLQLFLHPHLLRLPLPRNLTFPPSRKDKPEVDEEDSGEAGGLL